MLDLFAEQRLADDAEMARCSLQAVCDPRTLPDTHEADERQLAALLGPEKLARFDTYQESLLERKQVIHLRSRLDAANMLSDADSERLITALSQERYRIQEELSFSGESFAVYGGSFGATLVPGINGGGSASDAARLELAATYNRRTRARAAQILTPAQTRALEQIQDEALTGVRRSLEYEALSRATQMTGAAN